MDFELSPDQVALRDAAREMLDDLASPERVRVVVNSGGGHDAELWKAMVEQGWTGISLAEDRGGLGLGAVEAAVLFEEVGAHLAPAPIVQTWLAIEGLAGAAEDGGWVERLVAGDGIGCVAWRPPEPVVYAPSAGVAVVVAPGEGELVAIVLDDARRPPREPAMDLTREVGWLDLDAIGGVGGGGRIRLGGQAAVHALLDRAAVAYSAELLGASQRVLDMTVAYAKDRVQFGKPIGSFQAVKHRCADMLVDVEGMRSAVYYAAWCLSAAHPDASVAASTAKVWCADASKRVMASGLQVHGGIGFTWEHDLHLYLKRAQLDQVTFGDATFHRQRLAALLRPRVERGESVV